MRLLFLLATFAQVIRIPGPGGSGAAASLGCGATYAHCRQITVPSANVLGTEGNYIVVRAGTATWLKAFASGGQIRNTVAQTGGSGLTVPADHIIATSQTCATKVTGWEWVKWNSSTGDYAYKFNAGTVTAGTAATYWECYNASSVTTWQGNVPATYDSNYVIVLNFGNGTTLSLVDSKNGFTFIPVATPVNAPGVVAGGVNINGGALKSDNHSEIAAATGPLTVQFWLKTSTTSTDMVLWGTCCYGPTYNEGQLASSNALGFCVFNTACAAAAPGTVQDNVWHQMAGVFDGTLGHLYVDGVEVGTPGSGTNTSWPDIYYIGNRDDSGRPWVGSLSEHSFSKSARSGNRIAMEYANVRNLSTWTSIGAEQ